MKRFMLLLGAMMILCSSAIADPCVLEDNGSGTVYLPPEGCSYLSPDEVHMIIDGLPPGTTIELAPIHLGFFVLDRAPGGSLGGEVEIFESVLIMELTGTGELAGYARVLEIPILCEVHIDEGDPGASVQVHVTDMRRLEGSIGGDPDFEFLGISGGTDFVDPPSVGETTIIEVELPEGHFNVDSFFDITYEILFIGATGGPLEGLSGTTTDTIRMQAGDTIPAPLGACCSQDGSCTVTEELDCLTFEWLIFEDCDPNPCPQPEAACCLEDGSCTITIEADCPGLWLGPDTTTCDPNPCPCIRPDSDGTVLLPPEGCPYLSPDEVHQIIDGLPPGTTIELDPIHHRFINPQQAPGGTLGGEIETFESTLGLDLRGTGDLAGFNRYLEIEIACEVHTGPRLAGKSVQEMDNDMFRLQGALVGDPDFDQLLITGGTDYGLPSPGQTTLTRLPTGDFNVDSFFDITYRIDFIGAPGSVLEALSGSTVGTIRMETGISLPTPVGVCCSTLGECSITEEADCTHVWLFHILECDPNPCGPFPTEESSWGTIKAKFK